MTLTIIITLMMIVAKKPAANAININIKVINNNNNEECKKVHANNEKSIIMADIWTYII